MGGSSARRAWVVLSLAIVGLGCGDDDAPLGDGAMPFVCSTDVDCDDGLFCNGTETCAPGDGADARGCVRSVPPCLESQRCLNDERRCVSSCAVQPDADGDGFDAIECGGADCDDTDRNRFPGNTEVCDAANRDEDCDPTTFGDRDADGDGEVDSACCNEEMGIGRCGLDCNDRRRDVSPDRVEACDGLDNDCDGSVDEGVLVLGFADDDLDLHGDPSRPMEACAGTPRFATVDDDCDDTSPVRHGAQLELCDGIDNDCDGVVDESPVSVTWYPDDDGDGFGFPDPERVVISCVPVPGFVTRPSDCDDTDRERNPGARERCNGIDDDCDGVADFFSDDGDGEDDDGDGIADMRVCGGPDCDDTRADVGAGSVEVCDEVDNDCDGVVDERDAMPFWYLDRDGDGFGDASDTAPIESCEPQAGRVPNRDDCDDSTSTIRPGVSDPCGRGDEDCDGEVDENGVRYAYFPDADGDGFGSGAAGAAIFACTRPTDAALYPEDCDDADATRHPGRAEECDGADQDCDETIDEDAIRTWYRDADGDGWGDTGGETSTGCAPPAGGGWVDRGGDCTDADPMRAPMLAEACDGVDQDCDGTIDEGAASRCAAPRATVACTEGACEITACAAGYADCDGAPSNGCEVSTGTSVSHCGGCDMACGYADTCGRETAGTCDEAPFVEIAIGAEHVVARRSTGTYVAWGGNGSGELGAAVGGSTRTPTLGGAVDLVQIDVGRGNTCGRTRAGTVLCWGADNAGQLGNGLPFAGGPGAVQVQGITDAIDVSVGHWHACAVLSTGGVRCWGYRGSTGSLGDGVAGVECGFYGCTPDQTTAYSAVPVEVVGIADARDVACMDRFCCAMRSGNRVSCWGTGTNGQLGDGRNVSSSTPVDVVGLPSDTTLARFSTGFANALCVITGDGIPLCWGNVPAVGSSSTPTPLFGLTNVVDVSLEGYYFVMGTFGGGNGGLVRRRNASGGYEVLAWGDDESGQNGSATAGYSSPGLTSLPMPDAIAIARMAHTSCVIRADGMPWCVGRSIYVGDGLCPRTSTTTYDAAICLP